MMSVRVFCFAVWADGATASLNLNLDFRRDVKWIYLAPFPVASVTFARLILNSGKQIFYAFGNIYCCYTRDKIEVLLV